MNRSIVKLAGVLGLLAVLILMAVGTASADSLLGGKIRTGDVVTVSSTEVVNSDLYAFAREVVVNGVVNGDVVAAGGSVTVNGTVHGDVIVGAGTVNVAGKIVGSVIAGGGTVNIDGTVGGAIRTGGGQLTIGGTVARDVLVAGGTLNVGGTIGGDLILGAGQATITGSIAGSIEGQAQTYTRTGTLGGTEHVDIRPASTYQGPVPTLTYTTDPILDAIRHFVTVVLFAALALWLVPGGLLAAEATVRRRPLPAFGAGILALALGIVALLAVLIVMVILAIGFGVATLGGLVLLDVAVALLAFFGLLLGIVVAAAWGSVAVVGLGLAEWAWPRLMPARRAAGEAVGAPAAGPVARPMSRLEDLGLLAVGVAVVVILTSLPIVGPIAEVIVVFLGLGAIGIVLWQAWQHRRSGTVPEGAAAGGSLGVTLSWGHPAGS
jgi:hypothetical protein